MRMSHGLMLSCLACALGVSTPALADTECQVDLTDAWGRTVMNYWSTGYNYRDACNNARQLCEDARGGNPGQRCVIADGGNWPGSPGYPYPVPYPPVDPYPPSPPTPYPPFPPHGGGQYREVRCESNDFNYRECNAGTGRIHSVQVLRQRSDSYCVEGRSYGVRGNRIWVDQGCRGVFGVYFY